MKGPSVRMSGEKGLVDLMAGAPKYPDAVEAALENKNLLNIKPCRETEARWYNG